jgi:hypothetical protein
MNPVLRWLIEVQVGGGRRSDREAPVRPLDWAGSEISTQWNGFFEGVVASQLADEKIRKVVRVTIADSATRAARGSGPVSEARRFPA